MISPSFTQSCFAVSLPVASMLMTRFVLSLLQKAARNTQADVSEGTAARVATYPVAVRAVAWGLLILGTVGAVPIAAYNAAHGAVLLGTVIGVAMVVVLVGTVAEFTRVRVEWTETAVSFASPWSAPRRLEWDEIVDVTYSRAAGWFVVRGRSGVKIRLSHLLGGLGDLLEEMRVRGSDDVRRQIERAMPPGLVRPTDR
jgi:hypothetical protein